MVAEHVNDEGATKGIVACPHGKQIAHVKEIARMLMIERSHDLTSIEVLKRGDLSRSIAERIFDCFRNRIDSGRIRNPAIITSILICTPSTRTKSLTTLEMLLDDFGAPDGLLNPFPNPFERVADRGEQFSARPYRQVR